MILNIITLLCIIIRSTKCSIVHDTLHQELKHVSKYCPKQKYCKEGTHVVCMYYQHNYDYGPRCGNPIHIQFSPTMIQQILTKVNEIRGRLAMGVETGRDGNDLPRAYGLMKLQWDRELAILAQVLANQCLGGKEDVCRATNRFPNPSQSIFVIRYKYPNWDYMRTTFNNSRKGLNKEKLMYAINSLLRTTHALKRTVTADVITNCPEFNELSDVNLKLYLNLIRGGATHIGCGVSAYSENHNNADSKSIQNRVEIVCNISDAPRPGQPVYNTMPPISGRGYSKRCGCPRGYKETRSCLCEKKRKGREDEHSVPPSYNLKKAKVNLRSSLWPQRQHTSLAVEDLEQESSGNIEYETFHDDGNVESKAEESKIGLSRKTLKSRFHIVSATRSPRADKKSEKHITKNNYFSKDLSEIAKAIRPNKNKHSILSNRRNQARNSISSKSKHRNQINKHILSVKGIEDLIFNVSSYGKYKATTESTLEVVEEIIDNNYQDTKEKFNVSKNKSVHRKIHNNPNFKDKKLVNILNSLEQEVNNLKFDEDLKRLFYSKMKKIYETGLNKTDETPSLSEFAKQLNIYINNLNELRDFLEHEDHAIVEDKILKYARMIHHLPKVTSRDNKATDMDSEKVLI